MSRTAVRSMPSKVKVRSRTSGRSRNFHTITRPAAKTAPSKQWRARRFVSEMGSVPVGLDVKSGPSTQATRPRITTKVDSAPRAAHSLMVAERGGADTVIGAAGIVPALVAVLTDRLLVPLASEHLLRAHGHRTLSGVARLPALCPARSEGKSGMSDYDPYSFEVREDPYLHYEKLRKSCPVHHHVLDSVDVSKINANPLVARPTTEFWSVM